MRRVCVQGWVGQIVSFVLAVGLGAGLPFLSAAQSGQPLISINQVLTEEFPQVVSYVTVVDSSGLALSGLTEVDFTVREDGDDVSQFSVDLASQEGIQLVLAVDTSGSMLGGTALRDAQAAAKTFLSQLGPQDQAALIVFAERADIVQDFTADLALLEAAVDGLSAVPQARTALYEAAFEAGERMVQVPAGRKAVIIFTDGSDTVGGFTLKDAIDKAQEANVPVYAIGLQGGQFDPAPMRQLAEGTGGFYVEAPNSQELSAQFQAVRELLEQQYAIRYTSALHPDNRPHDLGIAVTVAAAGSEDHHSFLPQPLTPWVRITTPSDGEAVAGTVPVAVDVAARDAMAEVTLLVDGNELTQLSGPPYRHDWDTAPLAPGSHVLSARATDVGDRSGSGEVRIDVNPTLTISLTSPAEGAEVAGLVDVRPDIQAARRIDSVTVSVDGALIDTLTVSPYNYVWDTATLALGRHTLTVAVEDDDGARAQAQVQVNVVPALTMTISSPREGDSVIGVVDVQPEIQAVRRVREVLISVDGTALSSVPAPPYTYRWDTAELTPGSHQVTVRAEDERGALAQAQVRVDVQPVLTTAWVSPRSGDEMTATVTLIAQAESHYGVERVEFYANDNLLGAVTNVPFQLEWSTLNVDETQFRLSACAYDVLGHEECAGDTVELKRPGPSTAMFVALGFLILALMMVTVMVVRTRQRQATRAPSPVVVSAPCPVRGGSGPQGGRESPTVLAQQPLAPGGRRAASLIVQPGQGGPAHEVSLAAGEIVIGRARDSGIWIDDDLASRQHAVLRYQEDAGGYVFRDLSPTNPSEINGQAYRRPHLLQPGDTIMVGSTILTFRQ